MIFTPGPAIVFIPAGLALLATEFEWARRLLQRVRPLIDAAIEKAKQKMAAEKDRLRQQKARETERLYKVVGEACCKAAARADFGPLLKAVLEAGTDQRTQDFLREKGVL